MKYAELNDFAIKYKSEQLDNILMATWTDLPIGVKDDGSAKLGVFIKVVYVNKYGIACCIEDDSRNFVLTPKIVDHD